MKLVLLLTVCVFTSSRSYARYQKKSSFYPPTFINALIAKPDTPEFFKQKSDKKSRQKRHKLCIDSLEKYFTKEVSKKGMTDFLVAQYELTTYRVFGSIIAQRLQNVKDKKAGKRSKKEIVKYSEFIKEHLEQMKKNAESDSHFLAAMKSFDQAPLSIGALAKLAPYVNKNLLYNTTVYDNPLAAKFKLDSNDFKMLDVLASVEKQRTQNNSSNFLRYIEKIDDSVISQTDASVNLPVLNYRRVAVRKKQVEMFLKSLAIPKECKEEKRDIALGLNCYKCFNKNDDTLFSLTQISDEITQVLFDSVLKRADLKDAREGQASDNIIYVGRKSPWGSIENGNFRP